MSFGCDRTRRTVANVTKSFIKSVIHYYKLVLILQSAKLLSNIFDTNLHLHYANFSGFAPSDFSANETALYFFKDEKGQQWRMLLFCTGQFSGSSVHEIVCFGCSDQDDDRYKKRFVFTVANNLSSLKLTFCGCALLKRSKMANHLHVMNDSFSV